MNRIDLASPILRESENPYSEFVYAIKKRSLLPQPDTLPRVTFSRVLTSRHSRRTFTPLSPYDLNMLLWHSARAISVNSPAHSSRWQHRPAPSGGGRHPIDILVCTGKDRRQLDLYQPEPHALAKLKVRNAGALSSLHKAVEKVIDPEHATILWFAAQFGRTLSRYKNGESLVWRDAGALIAVISLVAECLNFNCCAIGITGEPYISEIFDSNGGVIGVGGMLVGKR